MLLVKPTRCQRVSQKKTSEASKTEWTLRHPRRHFGCADGHCPLARDLESRLSSPGKRNYKKGGNVPVFEGSKSESTDSKFKFKPVELPRKGFNSLESPHCASMRVDWRSLWDINHIRLLKLCYCCQRWTVSNFLSCCPRIKKKGCKNARQEKSEDFNSDQAKYLLPSSIVLLL